MTSDPILAEVADYFASSVKTDSFNGIPASSLQRVIEPPEKLRQRLEELVLTGRVTCVFASTSINPHIKRLPDLDVEEQITHLHREELDTFCVYPSAQVILESIDISQWTDRPFSKQLALAEPQLSFRAFNMGVLERYTGDPRYVVHFADYMGRMSITDEYFLSADFPGRDKVSLQTFGLGFDESRVPHTVVFLRYLSDLSPEHQQYWNSYLVVSGVRMAKQYFQSSILGEFWKNRSVRYAITEEMRIINAMSVAIWGRTLFSDTPPGDIPIGLTSFLRPTTDNFHRFIMALDKLLSEAINLKFFEGRIALETEKVRPDGKIEVHKKGTLQLLGDWLLSEIAWEDKIQFRKIIIDPLREVRRLRQKPAHAFTKDSFSNDYYELRRRILWAVFNSLSNIRGTFGKHPRAAGIEQPSWLDDESIDVF